MSFTSSRARTRGVLSTAEYFGRALVGAILGSILFMFLTIPTLRWVLHLPSNDWGLHLIVGLILGSAIGGSVIGKGSWRMLLLFGAFVFTTAYPVYRIDVWLVPQT